MNIIVKKPILIAPFAMELALLAGIAPAQRPGAHYRMN